MRASGIAKRQTFLAVSCLVSLVGVVKHPLDVAEPRCQTKARLPRQHDSRDQVVRAELPVDLAQPEPASQPACSVCARTSLNL